MYKVTKYPHGTFSWAENISTDRSGGEAFYMELLGWGKNEVPMGPAATYTMFTLEGGHVAAMASMASEMQKQGIPSHWNSYVAVDDVDALVDAVTEGGGSVVYGPLDVFDSGRMLFIQDPTGGRMGLWQAGNHIGAEVVNKPGAMLWNELWTPDAQAAKAFYSKLLGWEYFDEGGYIHIRNRGRGNGGIVQMSENPGGARAAWVPYFHVSNLDESIKLTEARGGKVLVPKTEADAAGVFAVLIDPTGACFNLMQAHTYDTWEE